MPRQAKRNDADAQKQLAVEALALKLNPPEQARHGGPNSYDTFDAYAKDHPDGEHFRNWLTSSKSEGFAILAMDGSHAHNSLPGSYLWASVNTYRWMSKGKELSRVSLHLHDSDDGMASRHWTEGKIDQALELLTEMKALAPFTFHDAVSVFGLTFE